MAFRSAVKNLNRGRPLPELKANPAVVLYRQCVRSVPRVLTLYDINMDPAEARKEIQKLFRVNASVKSERAIDTLLAKGKLELEEVLMQWKTRHHVVAMLKPEEAMSSAQRRRLLEDTGDQFSAPDRQLVIWQLINEGKTDFSEEAIRKKAADMVDAGEIFAIDPECFKAKIGQTTIAG